MKAAFGPTSPKPCNTTTQTSTCPSRADVCCAPDETCMAANGSVAFCVPHDAVVCSTEPPTPQVCAPGLACVPNDSTGLYGCCPGGETCPVCSTPAAQPPVVGTVTNFRDDVPADLRTIVAVGDELVLIEASDATWHASLVDPRTLAVTQKASSLREDAVDLADEPTDAYAAVVNGVVYVTEQSSKAVPGKFVSYDVAADRWQSLPHWAPGPIAAAGPYLLNGAMRFDTRAPMDAWTAMATQPVLPPSFCGNASGCSSRELTVAGSAFVGGMMYQAIPSEPPNVNPGWPLAVLVYVADQDGWARETSLIGPDVPLFDNSEIARFAATPLADGQLFLTTTGTARDSVAYTYDPVAWAWTTLKFNGPPMPTQPPPEATGAAYAIAAGPLIWLEDRAAGAFYDRATNTIARGPTPTWWQDRVQLDQVAGGMLFGCSTLPGAPKGCVRLEPPPLPLPCP